MAKNPETFSDLRLFERGIGQVIVARYKSGERAEAGVFLVDTYCLGVKNAFFFQGLESVFRERLLKLNDGQAPEDVFMVKDGAWGRKLVEDAVAYARGLGFLPHPDFKSACRVFGGMDAKACQETFVFGKDGKPMFISGPGDSPAKIDRILRQLESRCGQGGYHYITGFGGEDWEGDGEFVEQEDEDGDGFGDEDDRIAFRNP